MTEIPANTPNPIGSTDSVVPGSWNFAALEVAVSAAEVADDPDWLAASAAAVAVGVPDATLSVAMTEPSTDVKPCEKRPLARNCQRGA